MAGTARIVLFGATGFTGRLTADALVSQGVRPVLAGRHPEPLAALAAGLGGLEVAVADVSRPASIRGLVDAGDVLITTVGPFAEYGGAAIEAAIDAGAHYLDSTGEAGFIRRIFQQYGPRATSAAVLTGFGYDYVPGNLAGALALRESPAAARVDVGYFFTGADGGSAPTGMSSGTAASSAGMLLAEHHALRAGRLVLEPIARHLRAFPVGGRSLLAASIGGTEPFALPRIAPGLVEVGVYVGWFGTATRPLQALSLGLSAVRALPGLSRPLEAVVDTLTPRGTGRGPDAALRARRRSLVVAICADVDGRPVAQVEVGGKDGYDLTACLLAWGAQRLAEGAVRDVGALGPVDAFGLDVLAEGCAQAGLVRV